MASPSDEWALVDGPEGVDRALTAVSDRESRRTAYSNEIRFLLNGRERRVSCPDPRMTLAEYLRNMAGLTGTKLGCEEGGCGACTVLLSSVSADSPERLDRVVNACLRPLCSVDGMVVTTVEGLGNARDGLHPLQQRITQLNGSQCGFCTPGMVMNMYGLLAGGRAPSCAQVEERLDGNLCRCTGYRPIVAAFQSFARDAPGCCGDIEDLCKDGGCKNTPQFPLDQLVLPEGFRAYLRAPPALHFAAAGHEWYRPRTLEDVERLLAQYAGSPVQLVVGNTSKGVVKYYAPVSEDSAAIHIDIGGLPELRGVKPTQDGWTVGAAVTITELITCLETLSSQRNSGARHLPNAVRMLRRVATEQVRGSASWAGNVAMVRQHPDFASDLVPTLLGLGVALDLLRLADRSIVHLPLFEFLSAPADTQYVILSMYIPASQPNESYAAYKVAQRHQASHALVNAVFRMTVTTVPPSPGGIPVISQAHTVFGGFGRLPIVDGSIKQALEGQSISEATLQNAFKALRSDLLPVAKAAGAAPDYFDYQLRVAQGMLYKFLLSLVPNLPAPLRSAARFYERPPARATQKFTPDQSEAPVSMPIQKQTAHIQSTGQVKYASDLAVPGALHAQYVLATQVGAILAVDAVTALAAPGAVDFVTAQDVPGVNDASTLWASGEPVFAAGAAAYVGQPIGLLLADSVAHARAAAKLVRVTYGAPAKPPAVSIEQAVAQEAWMPDVPGSSHQETVARGDAEAAFAAAERVETGSLRSLGQYHFYMETQTSLAVPQPDGTLRIAASTQGPYMVQNAVAKVLNKPQGRITVESPHVGGGFGGKLTRCVPVSCAVAVAAVKTGQPVRLQLDRNTDMDVQGKRNQFVTQYKVGFNRDGLIRAVTFEIFLDGGAFCDLGVSNADSLHFNLDNTYTIENWRSRIRIVRTCQPPVTAMRAPGEVDAIFIMENVIEHVAAVTGLPTDVVRSRNLIADGSTTPYGQCMRDVTLPRVLALLDNQADMSRRRLQVDEFNRQNRWRKRGLATSHVKYGIAWGDQKHGAIVNVYDVDGSVTVSHSGVEIGQGIHTKVAQVAARALGVPLEKVYVNPLTSTDRIPNTLMTGSSTTSEVCSAAVQAACEALLARLKPVRAGLPAAASWQELIAAASGQGMQLMATGWFPPTEPPGGDHFQYFVYGAAVSEVEVDVLTGEVECLRSDLVYDCGTSLNPAIDVGQIEGAFAIGLGYVLTEQLNVDAETGRLDNSGTWEYKPVFPKDMPAELNVTLLNDTPNPSGFLRSKASAEPPLMLSTSVFLAIKDAVAAARKQAGAPGFFPLQHPATPPRVQAACLVAAEQMTLRV